MALRSLSALCFVLLASSAYSKERSLTGDFSGWSCNNGIIYNSDGAVALASGNYGGGPWVWLGGNDCQASAEAVAGTGFNDDSGAFAAAGAQAFAGGRKLLWGDWHDDDDHHDHHDHDNDSASAAASAAAASDGDDSSAAAAAAAAASGDGSAAAAAAAAAAGG